MAVKQTPINQSCTTSELISAYPEQSSRLVLSSSTLLSVPITLHEPLILFVRTLDKGTKRGYGASNVACPARRKHINQKKNSQNANGISQLTQVYLFTAWP